MLFWRAAHGSHQARFQSLPWKLFIFILVCLILSLCCGLMVKAQDRMVRNIPSIDDKYSFNRCLYDKMRSTYRRDTTDLSLYIVYNKECLYIISIISSQKFLLLLKISIFLFCSHYFLIRKLQNRTNLNIKTATEVSGLFLIFKICMKMSFVQWLCWPILANSFYQFLRSNHVQ